MVMRTIALLSIAALLCSCGGAGSFSVGVIFPDEQSKDDASNIRIMAIAVGEQATCDDLISGTNRPGDTGYPIEAQLDIALPLSGNPGALDLTSKGPKLFYAEAEDSAGAVFLRGCTPAEATGSKAKKITIQLDYSDTPCQSDSDCPDDGVFCNGQPSCQNGGCTNTLPNCDDQIPCTVDSCDTTNDACLNEPDHTSCADEQFCNGVEVCNPLSGCELGPDPCADEHECTTGSCDEDLDSCAQATDDLQCDDGTYCNGAEVCDQLLGCQNGAAPCDDAQDCTVDTCDEVGQSCTNTADDSRCDDGAFCNGAETCDPQNGCQTGQDPCADGVACTIDSCDEGTDSCTNSADDSICDDNDVCTGTETCDPQSDCQAGTPLTCDDGQFCNGSETCHAQNGCQNGPIPNCDDGYPCTADSCDTVGNQCLNEANAGGCLDYHIGPAPDTCPHLLIDDTPSDACDFTGAAGLRQAVAAASADGARFYLYDGGDFAYFHGPVDVPGNSWLGTAEGSDPANVLIASDVVESNGVLRLTGDNIHLQGLSLVSRAGEEYAISSWPSQSVPTGGTTGHLIENVAAFALEQEVMGSNSIGPPLALRSDTLVRNCYFFGYYEMRIRAENTQNLQLLNNTFVYYQQFGNFIDVAGTDGFVFANNVVLSLANQEQRPIMGDLTSTNLMASGNLLEGFDDIVTGLDPIDTSNIIENNVFAPAEMESPRDPWFLADSNQGPTITIPGGGQSIDGVDIQDRTDILPGAFQERSQLSLPRRDLLRLGRAGDCGSQTCDFDADDLDNDLQKVVWSAWPGTVIEVYPASEPYSGLAIIGWPVTIRGMGAQPEEVVLQNIEEDPLLTFYNPYDRQGHDATLIVLDHIGQPVILTNFSILLDTLGTGDNQAIIVEGGTADFDLPTHEISRIRLDEFGGSTGLWYGIQLGSRTVAHDILVNGRFETCIGFSPRRSANQEPYPSNSKAYNITCRQTGTGSTAASSVFDVANAVDVVIANVVAELEVPAPLFRAQRIDTGDTGAIALYPPASFTAHSISTRGVTTVYDGFTDAEGSYSVSGIEAIGASDPLFVDPGDAHLDATCTAIDSGVDPSTLDADLQMGTSLDGIDRSTMQIDRGCYEQGQ